MAVLLKYVLDKQRQKTEQYTLLYNASLRLMGYQNADVEISWNELESMSVKEQAEVFSLWAKGISTLIASAGMTKQQLYEIWTLQYPKTTEDTFDEFVTGLQDMATYKAFASSTYEEQLDAAGTD